ncbi:MAG: efflux transporter outer membrane subunit [Verrucomicrobiia bacterium]|jgi:NodT family efflux transporter outer membrane factor (OMF) lipoprotein
MRKNSFTFYFLIAVDFACIVLLSSGCKVGPDYKAPRVDMPKSWTSTALATNTNVVISVSDSAAFAKWWTNFNDPELVKLVESALKENLDLKIAIARIQQARASYGMTRASLFPSIGSSAAYDRFYQNRPSRKPDLFRAGVDALWELDLFGGNRRGVESAMANIAAAMEYYRDVRVSLAAEVALNYIQLRTLQQQIAIARDNLQAQRRTLSITQQRYGAGFVSRLDVANAEAQAATTESQISVLESSARQTIHNISILLGKAPGELLEELSSAAQIPIPPTSIKISVPSELLRRRPDIRRAEAQLHSATAKIGVATADLFPKFTITGSFSFQENTLPNFFSNPIKSGSVGPGVSWDIFRGGAIKSNIKLQEFLRDEAFINYQKTVLNALAEVENAIVALSKEQEHSMALQRAVESNRQAVEIALKLYSEGQADFLNVLNAQRSLLSSEDALAQSRRNISTALVSLYKALGGDWETDAFQKSEVEQQKN